MIDCSNSCCSVKLRGAAPQVALGLVSVMLHQVIVMNAASLGQIEMLKTDCFGKTRLVLRAPQHELKSVLIINPQHI